MQGASKQELLHRGSKADAVASKQQAHALRAAEHQLQLLNLEAGADKMLLSNKASPGQPQGKGIKAGARKTSPVNLCQPLPTSV